MLNKVIGKYLFTFLIFCGIGLGIAVAQKPITQNKGQWHEAVLFKAYSGNAVIYFKQNGISFLEYNQEEWAELVKHPKHEKEKKLFKFKRDDSIQVHYHHFELTFHDGQTTNIVGQHPSHHYNNYFIGQDQNKWATNVREFKSVLYEDVYPNIDILFKVSASGLKYDFILHPGAKVSDIKLAYSYLDRVELIGDALHLTSSLSHMVESIPLCYEIIDGDTIHRNYTYSLANGIIQFEGEKDSVEHHDLVIDPEVVFATYAGNSVDNFGFTATYDSMGCLYAGGIATAPDLSFNRNGNYPTTTGAFSRSYAGGIDEDERGYYLFPCDITLSKYSPNGTDLIAATYLGGWHNEYPHSIVVDSDNNLIVYGTTYSTNYPVSSNAFQQRFAGGIDIIVTKLNPSFTALIGSTYLGGLNNDGQNKHSSLDFFYADNHRGEVIVDSNDIIYAASCTWSTNFPTKDPFQSTLAGQQDGVLFSFNKDLSELLWSSYFGGTDGDALYTIDLDSNGIIYGSGGTRSKDLPGTKGKIGTSYKGGVSDGFIAKFDPKSKKLIKTAYWGTNNYDQIFGLEIDFENKVYVVGQSLGSMPVKGRVYSNANSGQFISVFDDELDVFEFGTIFGSGRRGIDITINAFLVDKCRKIYVSGWGGETSTKSYSQTYGLPITPDAYQKTSDSSDFYLIVLSKKARHLLYATYFGGSQTDDHVDGGTSRFDKEGVIYQSVCASCPDNDMWGNPVQNAISDFPTTPGAYSEQNLSPRCSNAAFKIAFGNLNLRPQLYDTIYSLRVFDTLTTYYVIQDPDEDSIFVTMTPELNYEANFIDYPSQSRDEAYWRRPITVTAGCEHVGDTFELDVYVIDKGCPQVLDSTSTIRYVVTPPPILSPPETICLNFLSETSLKLEWDPIPNSKYFAYISLYKISPSGDTSLVQTFNSTGSGKYIDTDVVDPKRTNYEYFLTVTNLCDDEGPKSYTISTTKEYEFPIEVTYVRTATVTDDDQIMVQWLQSTEEDFGSYDVYRKRNDLDESFEYLTSTYNRADTFIFDKDVNVMKQSYCYEIVVNDNCGHRSRASNMGCTIVLDGSTIPFRHDLWWNPYVDWPAGIQEYELFRCVDTGSLAYYNQIIAPQTSFIDTSFDYDWGGYWYRVKALEAAGGYRAESQSNRIYLIQPPLLHVPNAFTPNKDGLNELWGIVPVFVKEYHVQVYDRWGEKVYDSKDKKTDWDGFYKGQQYANNVYIYKIVFTGWDRSVHFRKGTVTVIK